MLLSTYKAIHMFWNLCVRCISVHVLSLLSCVHLFGLELDLENSLLSAGVTLKATPGHQNKLCY